MPKYNPSTAQVAKPFATASGEVRVKVRDRSGARTLISLGANDGDAVARFEELERRRRCPNCEMLALAYTEAMRAEHVTPDGAPSKHALKIQSALSLFARTSAAARNPQDFTPADLKSFREWLALCPGQVWARKTINEYVRVVVCMFQWGVEEGLIPETVWRALTAIKPVRAGRGVAGVVLREPWQVKPPEAQLLEACLAKCRPMLARMLRLQMVTGMRAGELVQMRPCDLYRTHVEGVSVYKPPTHKGTWRGKDRLVFLGPKAMAELPPELLAGDPAAPIFSPRRAVAEYNAAKRATRKTPRYPSHDAAKAKQRRKAGRRDDGDAYTTDSYRRAIWRACEQAWPHPTIKGKGSTPEEKRALLDWHAAHRVNPHQLRHAASTSIAEQVSLETARMLLGHADVATTMRYTHVSEDRAAQAAAQVG